MHPRANRAVNKLRTAIESVEPRQLLAGFTPLAPLASPLWATGYFTVAGTLDLQAGAALAPQIGSDEAASLPRQVAVNGNGLPLLQSRVAGAGTELFIDFARNADGRGTFSLDGDRENFNFDEQMVIYTCWREIVGFFSAFNVNVTTVLPPTGAADPLFSWIQITNDFEGGAAYVNWLSKDGPKGTVNSGDAVHRVSGIIHEYGHNLGLNHQGEFDKYGAKTAEYSDGMDYRNRPIMGVDYLGTIRNMTVGRTIDSGTVQDDVAVVAGTAAWSNGAGGDGYRPDDFGNTLATAEPIAAGGQAFDAFTERYSDADVFKIEATTAGPWNLTATPLYLSQAEPKLELLDAAGNIIAARDDADARNGPTNEQFLNVNLQPGTYYVRVTSGGDYAELGYYKFAASQLPANFVSSDIGIPANSGSVVYDSATGTFTQSGGGADIWGTSDQFRFTYATLTGNGSITARVDSIDQIGSRSKAGVMIRQSLATDSAHAFMGIVPSGGLDSIRRNASGGGSVTVNNSGSGPWVRLTRAGSVITYFSSTDGTSWTNIGSTSISMTGPVLIGLANSAWNNRFESFATFSNVNVVGATTPAAPAYNALPAPANLSASAAAGASTSVNLSWTAVPGATGYVIERSSNGVDFGTVSSVGSGTLTHTDANLFGSMRYFYRVSAANGSSVNSVPSAVTSVVNKPSAPSFTPGGFTPTIMAIGTNEVQLTWRDTQGETGYRIEQSTDGVNFVTRFNNPANHTVSNVGGLTHGTAYTFRIVPLTSIGDTVAPPLVIDTQTRMAAVTNLRFTAKSSSSMTIAWNDAPLEAGYRVERSTDGTSWSFMGDTAANVTTFTSNGLTPGTEYYFRIMPWNAAFDGMMSNAIFAAAPAASLPSGWTDGDIGNVAGSGAAINSGTAWTLVSGGNDISGSADAFHYTYRTLTDNQTIIARISTLESTNNAAKAGLMIRQDATAGSKFVAIMVNAGGGFGIDVRSRTTANQNYNYQPAIANVAAPYWLRLSRNGSTVSAAYSADGVGWTTAATISISLSNSFLVGMASTSFSGSQLNTSTFSNVSIGGIAPTVATAASVVSTTATTATLNVLGADANDAEALLTYTWSAAPSGFVTFTPNGSNSAKNSVATFTRAGTYTLTAAIQDTDGLITGSSTNVTIAQVLTGITAASGSIAAGTSIALTAADQFGDAMPSGPIVWSVSVGSITQAGIYTAPAGGATSAVVTGKLGGSTFTKTISIVAGRAWYKADVSAGTTLSDSSGSGNNGSLTGASSFAAGKSGNALSLTGGHATLPAGIVAGLNDFTIATWVYPTATTQWSRIFDFGTGTTANMFLTVNSGAANPLRFAITTGGGGGEQQINGPALALNTWTHVAVTLVGNVGTLYVNGVAVGTKTDMTLRPSSLGSTNLNYLGKSQYNDPTFSGRIDDFRILGNGLNAAGVVGIRDAWQTPTVATPAAATPGTFTGTTSNLSVMGASANGEAGLTYSWSVLGTPPADVAFSENGTNAAKNSVATFTASGTYQLLVTISNALGGSVTSAVAVNVTVPSPTATVTANEVFAVASHALRYKFDRDVGAQSWSTLIEIKSFDGTQTVVPSSFVYDETSHVLTVTLPAILPNGNYVATLNKGSILAADHVLNFFVLAGDADRDRMVEFDDLLALSQNYGSSNRTYAQGDFDGNGVVDFDDLLILAQSYGSSLPAALAATPADKAATQASRNRRRDPNPIV